MEQGVENNPSQPEQELDPEQENVLMAFVKDYPGISAPVRQDLLTRYKDSSTKSTGLIDSRRVVEGLLKKELEREGAGEDWKYHIMFAPYDAYNGERWPIPAVLGSAISPEGREEMEQNNFLPATSHERISKYMFQTEKAYVDFRRGKYSWPPSRRPSYTPPKE
mgnify:FL=1